MVWITLIALAISSGLAFGLVAAIVRTKGRRAAMMSSAALALAALATAALAYSAYLETRQGALPPDHFYNTVLGNIVVVGGLVASAGTILGLIAAYVALIKR